MLCAREEGRSETLLVCASGGAAEQDDARVRHLRERPLRTGKKETKETKGASTFVLRCVLGIVNALPKPAAVCVPLRNAVVRGRGCAWWITQPRPAPPPQRAAADMTCSSSARGREGMEEESRRECTRSDLPATTAHYGPRKQSM